MRDQILVMFRIYFFSTLNASFPRELLWQIVLSVQLKLVIRNRKKCDDDNQRQLLLVFYLYTVDIEYSICPNFCFISRLLVSCFLINARKVFWLMNFIKFVRELTDDRWRWPMWFGRIVVSHRQKMLIVRSSRISFSFSTSAAYSVGTIMHMSFFRFQTTSFSCWFFFVKYLKPPIKLIHKLRRGSPALNIHFSRLLRVEFRVDQIYFSLHCQQRTNNRWEGGKSVSLAHV